MHTVCKCTPAAVLGPLCAGNCFSCFNCSRVMSSGNNHDKSALLASRSEPDTEPDVESTPVVPGSSSEMVRPEVADRSGEDRPAADNVEDNPVAQNSCEKSGQQEVYLVAMLMAMLIVVTIAFTQSLSQYMIPHIDSAVALWTLISYMIVGLVVIFLLLHFSSHITVEPTQAIDNNGSTRTQKVNKILSKYLSLVGMSFFFPFACALELCYVVAGTSCDAQWGALSRLCKVDIFTDYWIDVFYHLMRIVFMAAELLLCLQFHRTRFVAHPLVRLSLLVIMVVNVALWFESLIHETEDREKMNDGKPKMAMVCKSFAVNETHENETLALLRCLSETTGIQKICSEMTGFLYPFTIEFSLLVGEFLAHKFFSCKERINKSQLLHPVEAVNGDNGRQDQLREENAPQINAERQSGSSVTNQLREGNVPEIINVEHQSGSSSTYLLGSVLIVAIGVGTNITFITLVFFAHIIDPKLSVEEGMPNPMHFFKGYSFFYYNLMLIFVILGFVFGWKFEIQKKEIRGIDYLVLLSAFGPLMYGQIYMTAIARNMSGINGSEYGQPSVLIADFVTNIVQLSLQAVFVFFAERVKPITEEQRSNQLLRHLHGAFKAVVFVMAICSLTNWIMDSILLDSICFNQDFLNKIFKPNRWFLVDGILLPLLIFYRFNSFLLFTRAYLNDKD